MAKIEMKVAATGFDMWTPLTRDQVMQIADATAESVSGVQFVPQVVAEWGTTYEIVRLRIATLGTCHVVYEARPEGNVVRFMPGDYEIVRSYMFFIIPAGTDCGALKYFRKYSAELHRHLQAAATTPAPY